jgi:hypothetical protein
MNVLNHVNTSKLLVGAASLMLNFGSRALIGELTAAQQRAFQHPMVKRLVVLCMYFVFTRDVMVSVGMALVTIVSLEALFNEGSRFCVMPGAHCKQSASVPSPISPPIVSISKRMINIAASQQPSYPPKFTQLVSTEETF